MSTKNELIDRVTREVMKLYSVPSAQASPVMSVSPVVNTNPVVSSTNTYKGISTPNTPLNTGDTSKLKSLVIVCGNTELKEETISRFRELKSSYRQTKVLLSTNAQDLFSKTASRPFAGYEYQFGDEGIQGLEVYDHFHLVNPTLNTLSKLAYLQADNLPALATRRALLWGKPVWISLDKIPRLPQAMMDEFNLIIEKLVKYGYQFEQEIVQSPQSAHNPASINSPLSILPPIGHDKELARYIDHTFLKPEATQKEIEKLCKEASQYQFASVCINPYYVKFAADLLHGSGVKVCTVIGFPLGATTTGTKCFEAAEAIRNGAGEIDMVLNISALKSKDYDFVRQDVRAVVEACNGTLVKVILETALLTREEIIIACRLCKEAQAHFVKTSTGFSKGGATIEHVKLMRTVVGPDMGVKASGGVRNAKDAKAMIEAGANRLGVSASIAIVSGLDAGAGKY